MIQTLTIIIIGVIFTILGIFLISKRRSRQRVRKETNYRNLFNVGIIYLGAGIAISVASNIINPLFILGLTVSIIDITNKDRWKT
jgi:H+/Cl- antiporter ClcA